MRNLKYLYNNQSADLKSSLSTDSKAGVLSSATLPGALSPF